MSNDVSRVKSWVKQWRGRGQSRPLALRRGLRQAAGLCLSAGLILGSTACGDDAIAPDDGNSYLRVVNSVFQDNGTDTTAIAIDFLIDSAADAPSVYGMAPASVSAGDSGNGYITLSPGVHSFTPRRAGDTRLQSSLYTTSNDQPFLPKRRLSPGVYYTMVVMGTIPATGNIPWNTIPVSFHFEDKFAGPVFNNVRQARFHVINAAAHADPGGFPSTVEVYLTKGSTTPVDVSDKAPIIDFVNPGLDQYQHEYSNVDAGTYVVTIKALFGSILAQQPVTFAAGEVKSLILQSTASGLGDESAHKLTVITDQQYAP